MDFNPLHREGGDVLQILHVFVNQTISIHSTARVETISSRQAVHYTVISIHSTARVETRRNAAGLRSWSNFNPLHREGGDEEPRFCICSYHTISIHSTARVETMSLTWKQFARQNFNPLHREGGDFIFIQMCRNIHDFNPLHREGGDFAFCNSSSVILAFQSTPPRGWRQLLLEESLSVQIFQSTPPRGWRRRRAVLVALFIIFQSTPPRGWRRHPPAPALPSTDFNPLHREGGDIASLVFVSCSAYFNPLHREGGDALIFAASGTLTSFQSTPPRGWRHRHGQGVRHPYIISIHSTARVETLEIADV